MLAALTDFLRWFEGGDHPYHTLFHCMNQDTFWIWVTVLLDIAVAAGYAVIARHWWINQRQLADSPGKRALASMRNIFIFCGCCGYAFIPIKMVYPAWRLYDFFMLALVYFTWKYAWGAKDLKVLYNEMKKSDRLQHELAESREEVRKKSFFLNAISHDLRTPLNGVLLQATLADVHIDTGSLDDVKQSLREIRHSTAMAAQLLDNLLEYARIDFADEHNQLIEIDLHELLADVLNQFQSQADQKGLSLNYEVRGNSRLKTDRTKLSRILSNLISNAVKFTSAGSVRVEVSTSGAGAEFCVIDTGVGISAENRERLFQEFFQVHNTERDRRKGFGLGLAIAHRLARQLGADIRVESQPGRGSRFSFTLRTSEVLERAVERTPVAPAFAS